MIGALLGRARSSWQDRMIRNAVLMLATTLLMALVGSLFWLLAARLGSPREVGLASSLATAAEALAIFAQLGLNVSLLRTMPVSDRPAADVLLACGSVGVAGAVFAGGYAAVLPMAAPRLSDVVGWPVAMLFALCVAGTAVNQLTDGIFLAVDRVAANFWINGSVISAAKIGLPFILAGAGAFALFGIVGGSSLVAASVSVVVIVRRLPARRGLRPSAAFREARRFAGAGYLSNVLYMAPQLIFPLLIIDTAGPEASAAYFIAFQIVTLLNHGVYTLANSMQAEAARTPEHAHRIVAKAGRTMLAAGVVGIAAVVLAAPWLLRLFGAQYAADGTDALRLLALSTFGVGLNYWSAVRLRILHHLRAMVGVQCFATVLMLVLAVLAAPHGIEWVAAAWGVGQFAGGVVGYVAGRLGAPSLAAATALTAAPAGAAAEPARVLLGAAE